MADIGIYWADFAPANHEHLRCAQEMIDKYNLDALYLVDFCNEHNTDKEPLSETRLQMLADVCEDIDAEISLFLASASSLPELQNHLSQMYGNVRLFLDATVLRALAQDEWVWLNTNYQCVGVCTIMAQRILQEEMDAPPAEFWNVQYSNTTARRMMQLGCGDLYFTSKVLQYAEEHKLYGLGIDCNGLTEDALLSIIEPLYDAKRFVHAKGCRDTAVALAAHYGADQVAAARAGMLHDITKALPLAEQLQLCKRYGIMTERYQDDMAKILHGKTAAAIARHRFRESSEVCSAIEWHTTGRADMSLLEKIIYIADYIEPARTFTGVVELRTLAFRNLDAAVIRGIDLTIDILTKRNCSINRDSLEARDYLMLGDII